MRKQGIIRTTVAAFTLAVLACGAPLAGADEPPPDDFPPPVKSEEDAPPPKADAPADEAPKPPPKVEPPAKKPAAKPPAVRPPVEPSGWSPPAVTPGGTTSALPPPRIVRRGGSSARTPTMPPAPAGRAPRVDVPAMPAAQPKPPPPRPPGVEREAPPPVVPSAPPPIPATASASRVFGIAKTHNVALSGGDLALQMDVDYEVRGQAGRDVYVGIWFVRRDTGRHIRAAVGTYADANGFVTLQTRTARVRGNAGRFTATLKIPYRAFPVAQSNESYEVEARVQILRADGAGRATSLAKDATTFTVYGYTEEEAAAEETDTAP